MRVLGLLAALVTSLPALGLEPKIEKIEGNFYLDIGKNVQDALRKFDPYFQAWTETDFIPSVRQSYKPSPVQTLAGVVGDFNGDRKNDVVLMGRGRDANLLLAALSDGNGGYEITEIDRGPVTDPKRHWIEGPRGGEPGMWTFLSHVRPGYVTSRYEKKPISLKTEAVRLNYYASAAVIYFLKDGQFQKYTIAD